MSEDAIRRPQYAFSNQFFQITFSSKTQDAITNSILCVWGKSFFKICIWSSLHHWRHHNSWKKEGCIILRFVLVLAGARLNSHMKEAILAQGYIRRTTMSSVDMPIYLKRRLWRHMTKLRMSNFARAIRPWQSVCSFVTKLLMLRQGTTLSRPAAKPQKKLVKSFVRKHIAHVSLSRVQIRTFNYIIAVGVYQATNKIIINSHSLDFYQQTKETKLLNGAAW